jgi:hypothetical protein
MDQFTQTTVLQPLMRIRRKRLLPIEGEVIVGVGQEVPPLHVLARAPISTEIVMVPLCDLLKIKPDELSELLQVRVGETVSQDTVLAAKKRLIGAKEIMSPIDGQVAAIENGRLVLKQTTDWHELRAMVHGRVLNNEENLGVSLEIVGALIQGMWASGDITIGVLHMASDQPNGKLHAENIPDNITNLVLTAGNIDDPELLKNLADQNVRGLIAGSMPAHVCETAVSLGLSIILTDGIGKQTMAEPIYQLLHELVDEDVSLFTQNNHEAGERPEIIVPRPGVPKIDSSPYNKPLAVGDLVRIVQKPYQSQIGTISKILNDKKPAFGKLITNGAMVRITDGRDIFVPTANIDRFI